MKPIDIQSILPTVIRWLQSQKDIVDTKNISYTVLPKEKTKDLTHQALRLSFAFERRSRKINRLPS